MYRALRAIVLLTAALLAGRPAAAQETAEALLHRGEMALAGKRYGEAERLFQELVSRQPGLVDAYRGLARSLAGQDRRGEAAGVLARLGEGLLGTGQHDAAADVLGEAAELDPGSARLQALLGKALLFAQDHLAATAPLERALELGDRSPSTRLYLAAALWETGRPGEAEAIYRRRVEEAPGDFLAVHQLGRLLLWQGRAADAVPHLRRAAAMRPAAADVAFDLAQALAAADELDAALAAYRRAVELAPGNFKAHYGLGRVLARRGEGDAARQEMAAYQRLYAAEQERTQRQSLERARLDRGWELVDREDYEEAVRHFSRLAESSEAQAGIATAYSRLGDHRQAVEHLQRAVSLAPERRDLRLMLTEERLAAEDDG